MKTILIADDDPTIAMSLEYLLEQAGYNVLVARDGRQAMDSVQQDPPDLILLDVMMPHLTGYDVCQRIRENPAWRHIRVLMISAKGREIEVRKGLALGADSYITKPFSMHQVLREIRRHLGENLG